METAVKSETGRVRPAWIAWALLALGILAASVSAILIRYAQDANPLAISFWRCALGAVALLPFARWRQHGANSATVKTSAIAGFFLALHFASWITSVGLTSVASSVLLVSTTPVFVALIVWLVFKERLESVGWFGISLTLLGVGLVGGGDFGGSSGVGNLLALIGGATVAGYLILGAVARRTLGIVEYAVVAYATAGVILLPVCLLAGVDLWGYDSRTWWALAALVVGPQLLGHTVINSVLTEIDATTVAVTIMAEPIIATGLAFVLFSEEPSLLIYPGGILILIGIYLVTTVRKEPVIPLD